MTTIVKPINRTTWSDAMKDDVIWYTEGDKKGKLKISTQQTLEFLKTEGFNIILDKDDRRANYQIIQIEDKQAKQHNMDTIRGFIWEYFNDKPSEWWDDLNKYGVSKIPDDKDL